MRLRSGHGPGGHVPGRECGCQRAIGSGAARSPAPRLSRRFAFRPRRRVSHDKDGSIIEGLAAEDFEITEDGKPQRVDSAEYIAFERWSPGVDPPSAETQRESFRLAADPRYRVVVVYVNRLSRMSAQTVRQPLIDLLTREIGPRDVRPAAAVARSERSRFRQVHPGRSRRGSIDSCPSLITAARSIWMWWSRSC